MVSKLKKPKGFSNVTVQNKCVLRSQKMPSENRPCNWHEMKKPSCRLSLSKKGKMSQVRKADFTKEGSPGTK